MSASYGAPVLRFAGFELDLQRSELRRQDGETVRLRPKSFALVQHLARNAGRIVSKQELMEAAWPNVHVGEDSLFQCIREIRSATGDDRRQLIKVVSGRGYLFDAEVSGPGLANPAASPEGAAWPERTPSPEVPSATVAGFGSRAGFFRLSRRSISVAASIAICAVGLAVAAPFIGQRVFPHRAPTIAVMAFADASNDPQVSLMAANVTDALINGLSRILNIRVIAPPQASGATQASAPVSNADLVLRGELQKIDGKWNAQARITNVSNDEVRWTTAFSVDAAAADIGMQQSRLAAGVGYPLAGYISTLIHSGGGQRSAQVVIDEAQAFINRTSREKAKTAREMLEKALADSPDNVDLQAALAVQLLRGIQTAWYTGDEAAEAETKARQLLERGLQTEPNYLPLLEGYCRFLTATNNFVDSLIACAKSLNQNPWDGLVLFHVGMSQMQLGRFDDALASFTLADRYDTPQVSRWTWLLGVGLANLFMDRPEDALPWLERSIAITPGTGRTHFLLATAYQRLGRTADAKAAIAEGMKIRPGTTAENVGLPKKNASEVYLARARDVVTLLQAAGMPER